MTDVYKTQLDRQLLKCARTGDAEGVESLLAQGADPCQNNSEPLVSAANNGHAECVKLLIPVSDPKAKSSLALRWASYNGHPECVKLLIPVSDPMAESSYALRWAAENGHADCVKLLIPVSDPKHNHRALQMAIDYANPDCAKLLIPASGPFLKRKKIRASVLSSGDADILSLMLAAEPLFLTGLDRPRCRDAVMARGHVEMAALLSSVIEQESLAAHIPGPEATNASAAPRRL